MTSRNALRNTWLVLAIAAAFQTACSRAPEYPGLTLVADDWVQRLCTGISRNCLEIEEIIKSSDGRELRVVFKDEVVVVSPSGEARAFRKPGRVAWMNDDHEWVAWSDDLQHGFHLQTDPAPLYVRGYPKFDSGGRFFTVIEGNEALLHRVKPFRNDATVPIDRVSGVFSRPPLVFVVGPDRDTRRLHVYSYRDTEEGLDFVANLDIQRPDGGSSSPFYVTDVTASGQFFAIHDVSDAVSASASTVRVFESSARRFKSIGAKTLPWATLFLSDELRQRVNSKSRFKLVPATATASRN